MNELDRLSIRDLRVRARVGVTAGERRLPQEVLVTLTLAADLAKACRSDRLRDTIDYKAIKKAVLAECEAKSYRLIERLAQRIAELALRDPRVERVEVTIQKPGALRFARCSEVAVIRGRTDDAKTNSRGRRRA